jgi:uncharacterized protein YndB with AHSA1/START domain
VNTFYASSGRNGVPITNVKVDRDTKRFDVYAEYAASVERVWDLWADPRMIERWWGPPTWPATFEEFTLKEGERVHYFMTGPDGTEAHGWWEIVAVDPMINFQLRDGFANSDGSVNEQMPTITMIAHFESNGEITKMRMESQYASVEDFDKVMEMGMEEGMRAAMGQIDEILG